jgi:hypothetical protein
VRFELGLKQITFRASLVNSQPFTSNVCKFLFDALECHSHGIYSNSDGGHYVIYFLLFLGNNVNCEMGVK